MNREQWRLADRVVPLLRTEIGMQDHDLAAALEVTAADLRPVLRVLYRQKRIDVCWSYVVLAPSAREGRRAA